MNPCIQCQCEVDAAMLAKWPQSIICSACYSAPIKCANPDYEPRIERTERERYEDRVADREAHNNRALSQYDAALRRGPW